ncbi:hypothetical protein [Tissierella simiarum]|nr:hypothetical protein [Tissierella simiarum]
MNKAKFFNYKPDFNTCSVQSCLKFQAFYCYKDVMYGDPGDL